LATNFPDASVYDLQPNSWYFNFFVDHSEAAEIGDIMAEYGLEPHEYGLVVEGLRRNPQAWLEFMMRYDQQLLCADTSIAL
jgi:hypothetical protein